MAEAAAVGGPRAGAALAVAAFLAARVNAFVADRGRPRFIATLDTGSCGRYLAVFLAACALAPLLAGLFLLRRARAPR